MPLGPEIFGKLKESRQKLQDDLFYKICEKLDTALTEEKDRLENNESLIVMHDGQIDNHTIKLSDIPYLSVSLKLSSKIQETYEQAGWCNVSVQSGNSGPDEYLVICLQAHPPSPSHDPRR